VKRFVRDVLINVLANLVAAAIIYLLAVLAGVLPQAPFLVISAVALVVGTILGLLSGWALSTLRDRSSEPGKFDLVTFLALTVFWAALAIGAIYFAATTSFAPLRWICLACLLVCGAGLTSSVGQVRKAWHI
jgi:hypothetical protein